MKNLLIEITCILAFFLQVAFDNYLHFKSSFQIHLQSFVTNMLLLIVIMEYTNRNIFEILFLSKYLFGFELKLKKGLLSIYLN